MSKQLTYNDRLRLEVLIKAKHTPKEIAEILHFHVSTKVGKCNIDENMELAKQCQVSSIPAFIIFRDGKPAANYVGAMPAAELKQKVEQALG